MESTSNPSRHVVASKLPPGRPTLTAYSDPGPRSCGVHELSRPTRYRVRADIKSTSSRGLLSIGSELTRSGPTVPADSDPGPKSCGVDHFSRPTRSRVQGAAGRRAVSADSDPGPKSCGVHQIFRPTKTRVQGAGGWNSSPGRLGPWSEQTQAQPAIPAHMVRLRS